MVARTSEQVAQLVQRCLRDRGPEGSRVRVLAENVREGSGDGDWWYVPVSFQTDPQRLYFYYELFSDVEEKLEDEQELSVLLVPLVTDPSAGTNLAG